MNSPAAAPPLSARAWVRFGLRVAAFAAVLGALLWIWTAHLEPFDYFPVDYPILAARQTLAAGVRDGDLIILGDSRPLCGLAPLLIGPQVVNLACPGGTPIEMYYAVTRALAAGQPRAALISFSCSQLVHDPAFWETTVRSGFLSPAETDEVCATARLAEPDREILGRYPWWIPTNRAKQFLLPRRFPFLYWSAVQASHYGRRGPANRAVYAEMLASRGQRTAQANPDREERDAQLTGFVPGTTNAAFFDRTLQALTARHVPVRFVTPPRREDYATRFAPAMRAEYEAWLSTLRSRYGELSPLGPEWPLYPPELFADAMHLNAAGAARWSEEVRAQISVEDFHWR